MPLTPETSATWRHLPHLHRRERTYFVTFATSGRYVLPSNSRTLALACCVFGHGRRYWLDTAVVMPDHVHMAIAPYEGTNLTRVLKTLKGVSSRLINLESGASGNLWQSESFDRIVRAEDDLRRKCEYMCQNPVRAGIAREPDDYRWIWRDWIEGKRDLTILSVLPDWLLAKR